MKEYFDAVTEILSEIPRIASVPLARYRVKRECDEFSKYMDSLAGDDDYSAEIDARLEDEVEEDVGLVDVSVNEAIWGLNDSTRREIFGKYMLERYDGLVAAPRSYRKAIVSTFADRYAKAVEEDDTTLKSWVREHERMSEEDALMHEKYSIIKRRESDELSTIEHQFALCLEIDCLEMEDEEVDSKIWEAEAKEKIDGVIYTERQMRHTRFLERVDTSYFEDEENSTDEQENGNRMTDAANRRNATAA